MIDWIKRNGQVITIGLSLLAGAYFLGEMNSRISATESSVDDMADKAADEICLQIVTRQIQAIEKDKQNLLPMLSQLSHQNGCIKKYGEELGAEVAFSSDAITAEQIEAHRQLEEMRLVATQATLSRIDAQLSEDH